MSPDAGAASSNAALSPSHSAITWPSLTWSPSPTSQSITITCWSAGLDPAASTTSTPASAVLSDTSTSRPPSMLATAVTTSATEGSNSSWFT
jgi:hypothetical protein